MARTATLPEASVLPFKCRSLSGPDNPEGGGWGWCPAASEGGSWTSVVQRERSLRRRWPPAISALRTHDPPRPCPAPGPIPAPRHTPSGRHEQALTRRRHGCPATPDCGRVSTSRQPWGTFTPLRSTAVRARTSRCGGMGIDVQAPRYTQCAGKHEQAPGPPRRVPPRLTAVRQARADGRAGLASSPHPATPDCGQGAHEQVGGVGRRRPPDHAATPTPGTHEHVVWRPSPRSPRPDGRGRSGGGVEIGLAASLRRECVLVPSRGGGRAPVAGVPAPPLLCCYPPDYPPYPLRHRMSWCGRVG